MRRRLIACVLVLAVVLTSCEEQQASPQSQEAGRRQGSYDALVAKQPAKSMNYSPSREAINFWIDTWDEPKKLSYVYLLASNGQMIGYYVFEGLPVTYCASLTPNFEVRDSTNGNLSLPAPGVDGVYYSGGQCNQYFGKDASTGQYIEYYAGQGISPLVYSEPLPRQKVEPLGFTTIEQARNLGK